ncbi:MAG: DNA recombination protein RmuC [Oscillospiraceae bacterium]|nr:DNA recombination protein RmuC [Oscillospiraceae bacterium]
MQWIVLILCIVIVILLIVLLWLVRRLSQGEPGTVRELSRLEAAVTASRQTQGEAVAQIAQSLRAEQQQSFDRQSDMLEVRSRQTEERLLAMERSMNTQLTQMRREQQAQLDAMRGVVDEKMQKVLDARIREAFTSVNDRLEQVYKGLGEMQSLAGSVGDLKRLLSNVKARGEIGEIRLEALLSDMLPEGQFVRNARIGKGTVEFALRLPEADGEVLLPIDAKFAGDTYLHLQEAYEKGDADAAAQARKALAQRMRSEAQDIAAKYLAPPETTDFGILFLPTEGLYTEAVRSGLPEEAFRKYRVFITGPSTLAAMLSTLQMGLRSIAVQKYSGEVWKLLGEVKTEFSRYAQALARTQDKLVSASDELERLVGVRTRQMERRLNSIGEPGTPPPTQGGNV